MNCTNKILSVLVLVSCIATLYADPTDKPSPIKLSEMDQRSDADIQSDMDTQDNEPSKVPQKVSEVVKQSEAVKQDEKKQAWSNTTNTVVGIIIGASLGAGCSVIDYKIAPGAGTAIAFFCEPALRKVIMSSIAEDKYIENRESFYESARAASWATYLIGAGRVVVVSGFVDAVVAKFKSK